MHLVSLDQICLQTEAAESCISVQLRIYQCRYDGTVVCDTCQRRWHTPAAAAPSAMLNAKKACQRCVTPAANA